MSDEMVCFQHLGKILFLPTKLAARTTAFSIFSTAKQNTNCEDFSVQIMLGLFITFGEVREQEVFCMSQVPLES